MTYEVKLDVFEGPLDLLLHLVSKERVNVADVSISTITEEYLKTVKAMGEVDIDLASAFLILAATLLELKSLKLLPQRSIQDPELAALLEERDHLLHRLIEYSTFKKAAEAMEALLGLNAGYFVRSAELPPELEPALPDILEGLDSRKLAAAAGRVLFPKEEAHVDTSHLAPIRVSVGDMVDLLTDLIRTKGVASFRELCRGSVERIDVVMRFLALLELFKAQSVEMEQSEPFSEIVVRWREPRTGR